MAYAIEVEIERNYAAFRDIVSTILGESEGRYALLKDQKLQGIYLTAAAAERAGFACFAEEPYSIQLVTDEPVDLGFISHALSAG